MPMHTRPMLETDIEAGLRLCRANGWNQLEADWRGFLESSPQGCRAAVCQDAGCEDRVIGTVATLNYQEKFGWISMLLVDPQWRGQGIGTRLLEEACQMLSGVETIRLDATPAGKLVYDKAGFQDEYRLVRMKAEWPLVEGLWGSVVDGVSSVVRNIEDSDWARLLAWDQIVFGADRGAILRRLFGGAPEYALIAESAGEVRGFLLGRHGFLAEHLGPLVALDELTARALVSAGVGRLEDRAQGRPLMIDAPRHTGRNNMEWNRWLESRGFREERPFIRMFRGTNSHAGLPDLVFAIAGPELG
ncbi:MAG TPA: GNAT family N-acetyltransferase [Candidatus Acidoferrales bacterium]|jgi:GNAT superfamily N-acetyltransferase|nr:GNAT family N-acetyltransferase [Candidatus Acidoferrales bacterium]